MTVAITAVGAVGPFAGNGSDPVPPFERRAEEIMHHRRHARVMNRTFELLLIAAHDCVQAAELRQRPVAPHRLAVVVSIGRLHEDVDELSMMLDRRRQAGGLDLSSLEPLRRMKHLPNVAASLVSIEHRAENQSLTLVGRDAGMRAIVEGYSMVASGAADAVLCGGADVSAMPDEAAAQWRARGSGAVLLFESRTSAQRRGATPLAIARVSHADSVAAALAKAAVQTEDCWTFAAGGKAVADDRPIPHLLASSGVAGPAVAGAVTCARLRRQASNTAAIGYEYQHATASALILSSPDSSEWP